MSTPYRRTHESAVPALVLGILAMVSCGPFTGIPAQLMGKRAMREIQASGGALDGYGMAQAGYWLGLICNVIYALAIAFLLVGVLVVLLAGG